MTKDSQIVIQICIAAMIYLLRLHFAYYCEYRDIPLSFVWVPEITVNGEILIVKNFWQTNFPTKFKCAKYFKWPLPMFVAKTGDEN